MCVLCDVRVGGLDGVDRQESSRNDLLDAGVPQFISLLWRRPAKGKERKSQKGRLRSAQVSSCNSSFLSQHSSIFLSPLVLFDDAQPRTQPIPAPGWRCPATLMRKHFSNFLWTLQFGFLFFVCLRLFCPQDMSGECLIIFKQNCHPESE